MKEGTNMPYVVGLVVIVLIVALFAGGANIQDHVEKIRGRVCEITSKLGGCSSNKTDVAEQKIKAADSSQVENILESIARAAEVFSIRAGGGGDSMFPTNAFSMSEHMPPVIAKSIDGCYTSSPVPIGGYVCRYSVDPGRTNFLCTASPANGYTGMVFTIRKDMKVSQTVNIDN